MNKTIRSSSSQSGVAAIAILLFFLILIGALVGMDYGYVFLTEKCGDTPIGECFSPATPTPVPLANNASGNTLIAPTQIPVKKTIVAAKGSFAYKDYSSNVTLNIPLEGGEVTGSFSGDCSGRITGNFTGGSDGVISGKAFGKCTPFIIPVPARATFTGKVLQGQKSVPVDATGGVPGFSGSGSLTLTY